MENLRSPAWLRGDTEVTPRGTDHQINNKCRTTIGQNITWMIQGNNVSLRSTSLTIVWEQDAEHDYSWRQEDTLDK